MIFGIWCAAINLYIAVSLALAAFLYGKVLEQLPHTRDLRKGSGTFLGFETLRKGSGTFRRFFERSLVLACAAAMAVGVVRMELQTLYYDVEPPVDSGRITAEVLKVSKKQGSQPKLTVRLRGSSPISMTGRKCLVTCYGASLSYLNIEDDDLWKLTGTVIEFGGQLEKPDTAGNPRCFDYRTYLRSQGISYVSAAKTIRIVKNNGSVSGVLRRRIIGFREGFIKVICNSQTEALLRGVLFGNMDGMDDDMKDDFRNNGTAHVLAVSALHVGLLYSIFRMLRKKFAVPGMTVMFLMVLGIYGTMTLWTVSVTRAAALILIMELGDRLDRKFDLLTSLGFVSMLVLIVNPYALYGTSFIMSYLAAMSIGMICPVVKRHTPEHLPDSIKTSISVQIGLVPYIAFTFNMVPLGAVIINIPVVLLLSGIVTVAAAAVPVYIISGFTGQFLNNSDGAEILVLPFHAVLDVAARIMIVINDRFADLDIISPDVVSPPLFIIAAYYSLLFLLCSESLMIAWHRKNLWMVAPQIVVIVITLLLSCMISVSDFDRADIVMVDVGQGDCLHLKFRRYAEIGNTGMKIRVPGTNEILIDGGGSETHNIGKNTLKPYLLKNGIRKVDMALATHLHTDHYKGIEELAEENMVRQVMTEGKTGDVIYVSKPPPSGDDSETADRIEIIWPDERDPNSEDENKNSLIFKVYIQGITMLVTGDLGEEGEHALVERYQGTDVLDCDVLKVCHHGSKYSSSAEFIEAVSPVVALIGVGKNNTYGHPSDEAIERLEACGARVFRTDQDGAIGIRKSGKALEVCRMKIT